MMAKAERTRAPGHLKPATCKWWESVIREYELEEHHRRLLTLAAECWDRCVESREALALHGLVFDDRWGQPHSRPEVSIERDSRLAFVRVLRELALDVDAPADDARPPGIRGHANLKLRGGA